MVKFRIIIQIHSHSNQKISIIRQTVTTKPDTTIVAIIIEKIVNRKMVQMQLPTQEHTIQQMAAIKAMLHMVISNSNKSPIKIPREIKIKQQIKLELANK